MMTGLERRVRTLEGGGGGKCPECGFDGDWSKVRTIFEDAGDNCPKSCGTCGRPLRIVLTWGEGV
jgi:hypothetical protein